MTLSKEDYARLMVNKGIFDEASAGAHHVRVAKIVSGFDVSSDGLKGMFGAVNVGSEFSWWDYGQVKLYYRNSLLLTEDSEDARLARSLFAIPEASRVDSSSSMGGCQVDPISVVSATTASKGSVSSSTVCGVAAEELQAQGAVLVNVC